MQNQILFDTQLKIALFGDWEKCLDLLLENPWGRTERRTQHKRDMRAASSAVIAILAARGFSIRRSHVTLAAALARSLVLRSSARILKQKRVYSQSTLFGVVLSCSSPRH